MKKYHILEQTSGRRVGRNGDNEWSLSQAQDLAYHIVELDFDDTPAGEHKEFLAHEMSRLAGDRTEQQIESALLRFGYILEEISNEKGL